MFGTNLEAVNNILGFSCMVFASQVALLKKRVKGVSDSAAPPEGELSQSEDLNSTQQSPPNEQEVEPEVTEGKQDVFWGSQSKMLLCRSCICFGQLPIDVFYVWTEGGNSDPTKLMEGLQKRVKRQENLLQKCKDVMRTHKERSAQLSSENETLQEQLQERLQELEKMKVDRLHWG